METTVQFVLAQQLPVKISPGVLMSYDCNKNHNISYDFYVLLPTSYIKPNFRHFFVLKLCRLDRADPAVLYENSDSLQSDCRHSWLHSIQGRFIRPLQTVHSSTRGNVCFLSDTCEGFGGRFGVRERGSG